MFDWTLFSLIGKNKKLIAYTVALMVAGSLANIGITASLCWAVSVALNPVSALPVGRRYLFPALCALAAAALRYATTRFTGSLKDRLGRQVKKELREKSYQKMLRLGVRSVDDLSIAGLTQVSMEGIEQLDLYFSNYLPQFFYALIAPVLLFILCVWIDWRTAALLLGCVPLIPLSIVAVSKYAKRIFAKYWGKYTSMGDGFLDSVQGLKELKIFRADGRRHREMNENAEAFRKITMKVLVMQLASTTLMDLVAFGGAGGGIALTLRSLHAGALSPASALFLVLTAVEFFLPLRALGSAFHVAMNGAAAGKKIIQLLQTPEPEWGTRTVTATDLHLNEVSFAYDDSRKIIDSVSLHVPRSGMNAIVGTSGSGKTTLFHLLVGALRPDSGEVKVGPDPLPTLSRSSYYSHLALVSYNSYLFNDTIRNNFKLAKPTVTDAEMQQALQRVNLFDFVNANGGFDKVLTEEAANLSGGQKQRLALAVQLVADADVYLFDEATGNIDTESEAIIMQTVGEMSRTKTILIISHRLENVVPADCIYYLKEGRIRESGTHDQLMQADGDYAALYRTQKELEEGYKREAHA